MYEQVIVEYCEGYTKVIMNRPNAKNAITPLLMNELIDAFQTLDRDDTVKAVFLLGAGEDFCAGMDLKYALDKLKNSPEQLLEDLIPLGPRLDDLIEAMSKPVISVVQGNAIAGGFILSYFCDLVIAAEGATFGDAHAKWGFVPGWHEPQRLARSIGIRKAKEFFLTGELISAAQAKDLGLVWKLVPDNELRQIVEKWGGKFAKMSLTSLGMMKQQLAMVNKVEWDTLCHYDALMRKDLAGGFCTEDAINRLQNFGNSKK